VIEFMESSVAPIDNVTGLSRRKEGFDSPWGYDFQWVTPPCNYCFYSCGHFADTSSSSKAAVALFNVSLLTFE
jgi:hypothetical protein